MEGGSTSCSPRPKPVYGEAMLAISGLAFKNRACAPVLGLRVRVRARVLRSKIAFVLQLGFRVRDRI